MAYLELNVEQVNQSADQLSYNADDIESLDNVVDPRLDISSARSSVVSSTFLAESLGDQSRRASVASSTGKGVGGANLPLPPPPPAETPPAAPAGVEEDVVYPNISPLVAEYVTAENPGLCSQVAQSIEHHSKVHSPRKARSANHRSPLKCMSQAADALSVQQSTIGRKPTIPVEAVYQELVEYPPGSVVTSVDQRTSWLRTILSTTAATPPHPSLTLNGTPRLLNPPTPPGNPTFTRRDFPSVHHWRRPSDDLASQFPDVDNLDSASVCSETESNLSWVSDVDDEIRVIKNMMVPRRTGDRTTAATQTDPLSRSGGPAREVAVETDPTDHFMVMREKAHLEGELETLQGELGKLVSAKSELKLRAAAAEARCQQLVEEKESAVQRESSLAEELQALRMESLRYGRVVGDYDSLVHSKDSEAGSLHDEAVQLRQENRELRTMLEELKVDLESRCGAVEGLKKKIAELHVEGQASARARAQLDAENASLRSQMGVVEKAKEWFREQLHESQQGRNRLHREHVAAQAEKIVAESAAEALRADKARLVQELADCRQRSVRDKEGLMKRLEDIEADLLEREATLSREASSAQSVLSPPPSASSQDLSLKLKLADLEQQLKTAESNLLEQKATLERERAELATEAQRLRLALSESELGRHISEEMAREGSQKSKRLQGELETAREEAGELRTQKTALEVALAAANEDKRVVGESLGALTANLARLEGNFKMMRTEQVAKAAQMEQLQREKQTLTERLAEADSALTVARLEFESQAKSRSQDQAVEVDDLRKQKADLERVLGVLELDLKRVSAQARESTSQLNLAKERLSHAEELQRRSEAEQVSLSQKNALLQSQLAEVEQRLARERSRSSAHESHKEDQAFWETRLREVEQALADREIASREQERMYKSNIRLLTRKLREKMKELKLVQLRQQSNGLPEEDNGKEAPQNGMSGDKEVVQPASLEATSTETADARRNDDAKHQELLLQLEKEQGKLAGSLRAQEELRECVEQLDRQLTEKVASIAELQCQLDELQERNARTEVRQAAEATDIQRELSKERALSKDLRQKIFEEKRANGHLKRQLTALREGMAQASLTADARRLEAQGLVETAQGLEEKLQEAQAKLESLQGELKAAHSTNAELQAQLRGSQERDPALEQQMKLLSWNVKEKTQEVAALKEHALLAEATHQAELSGLQKQLEGAQQQSSGLSAELMAVRKEKFTLQAKVQELKNVLRSRVDQCKELQKQLMEVAETTELVLPNPPGDYDDSYIADLLQQCSTLPPKRPLGTLQVCLDSLKQELSTLHSQIKQNVEQPKTGLVN